MSEAARRERAERNARREKIGSRVTIIAALLISLIGGAIAVQASDNALIAARAETGRGARSDLDEANNRLLGRGLPVFEVPPIGAPNYQLQRQAARAWAMSDYPEPLAQQVREEVANGRRPGTTPVLLPGPIAGTIRDGVVEVIPIDPDDATPPDEPTRGPSGPPGASRAPVRTLPPSPPAPAPGTTPPSVRPAPAPTTTRAPLLGPLFPLLPPVGPIRVPPLIGAS